MPGFELILVVDIPRTQAQMLLPHAILKMVIIIILNFSGLCFINILVVAAIFGKSMFNRKIKSTQSIYLLYPPPFVPITKGFWKWPKRSVDTFLT